jgi:hypothetical protein
MTGEERRHKEGAGALVTTARLVLTTILLASVAIAIGAGQPCNLAIQSRNHFAVVEMKFRDDVTAISPLNAFFFFSRTAAEMESTQLA